MVLCFIFYLYTWDSEKAQKSHYLKILLSLFIWWCLVYLFFHKHRFYQNFIKKTNSILRLETSSSPSSWFLVNSDRLRAFLLLGFILSRLSRSVFSYWLTHKQTNNEHWRSIMNSSKKCTDHLLTSITQLSSQSWFSLILFFVHFFL